jgi:hypothetical protein
VTAYHKKSPLKTLEEAVESALAVSKKARKHHQNLNGDNFYANKLAEVRANATNSFRELASRSAGDTSALAEFIEIVFSPTVHPRDRVKASRELLFALRTTWVDSQATQPTQNSGLFPMSILAQANRGYLTSIARQMNGCFSMGYYDACAVMMRRLLEVAIIEAFEAKKLASSIKDGQGNYLHLTDLVSKALNEKAWSLSRNTKKYLPALRDVGHLSAHGRTFHARGEDVEQLKQPCRVVIEEFLHLANLL